MPRVVPSQIVEVIEQFRIDFYRTLGNANAAHLAGILALVEQVPPDLLLLRHHEYSLFVVAVEELRDTLARWRNGSMTGSLGLSPRNEFGNVNAVGVICQALQRCP